MLTRRKLLRGAAVAGTAAALSPATAMFPWLKARGQGEPRIPRLILFYTPHGTVWDQWRPPSGGLTDWTFSPILAPLAAHRDTLTLIDGLAIADPYSRRVPHTYDFPGLWTGSGVDTESDEFRRMDHGVTFGWNKGVSIDQAMSGMLPRHGSTYGTLEFGVGAGAGAHPARRMIYSAPGVWVDPLDNPGRAWDVIFQNLAEPASNDDPIRRRHVLDTVLDDLRDIRPTLSGSEQLRLAAHEAALEELQLSIQPEPVTCTIPDRPMNVTQESVIDQQSSLLATAIGCGQTNIASLQVRIADNDGSLYEWAGIQSGGHHMTSHDTSAQAQANLATLYTWYAGRFAHLLDSLAAIPDGDGLSVLDNSLVIWGTEIGIGWNHDISNVPFVVAGGAAGRHPGGRYLQTSGLHNRLLVSAFHAMGLPEVETYGLMDDSTGPVSGLLNG
ncbi:MAG: DUF1552 domain-containing protein [Myxococcota bacterium]